eukprot:scaffold105837_cov48-Phaeocystis_antarctica.AAC.1
MPPPIGATDVACDPNAVDIEFGTKEGVCTMTQSNLGGAGPDSGLAELRYHAVGKVGEVIIDLVVRAASEYKGVPANNGCNGLFGEFTVWTGSSVVLVFSFEDAATGAPVTLGSFFFSFFDLDQHRNPKAKGGTEHVSISGFSEFTLIGDTTIAVKAAYADLADPSKLQATFTSTEHGTLADNPDDPNGLTDVQKHRSVTMKFVDTSSFTATFEVTGCTNSGCTSRDGARRFLFASKSNLLVPCPPSPPMPPAP